MQLVSMRSNHVHFTPLLWFLVLQFVTAVNEQTNNMRASVQVTIGKKVASLTELSFPKLIY